MKKFPIYKDLNLEPKYWGLSIVSIGILSIVFIAIFFLVPKNIIFLALGLIFFVSLWITLSRIENKYGSEFLTKYLTGFFNSFKGTKINLDELKNLNKK